MVVQGPQLPQVYGNHDVLHNGKARTGIAHHLLDSERLPPIWDVWLLWDSKDVKSLIAELCHAVERRQGLAMSNEGKKCGGDLPKF